MYRLMSVVLVALFLSGAATAAETSAPESRLLVDLAARQIRFLASATTPENVRAQIEHLAGMGSRVTGYPGAESAHRYVASRFRALRLRDVRTDTFFVGVPVDNGMGEVVVSGTGGRQLRAWCLWPNGARTPTTRPGGVVGPLVDAGDGSWEALDGQALEGSIVLMDFGSHDRWVRAASLGARAIVFADNDDTRRDQAVAKFLPVPADVPRVWVDRESADLMRARIDEERQNGKQPNARVDARMDWQSLAGYNVYGWLPGTDEDMPAGTRDKPQKWKDQVILLHAHFDATSVVPGLAPGAESAASITTLLEIARVLAQHRPDYSILFVATGGHYNAQQGLRDFLRRHGPQAEPAERIDFDLMLSLDISSGSDRIAAVASGDARHMALQQSRLRRAAAQIFADSLRYTDGDTTLGDEPASAALAGAVAADAGHQALSLVTAGDSRPWLDTPFDTPERLNYDNLVEQIRTLTALVMWAGKDPVLLQDRKGRQPVKARSSEGQVLQRIDGLLQPAGTVWVVSRPPGPGVVHGIRTSVMQVSDDLGSFRFDNPPPAAVVAAYSIDPISGAITGALDSKAAGLQLIDSQSLLLMESVAAPVPLMTAAVAARTRDGKPVSSWGLDAFYGATETPTAATVIHAPAGSLVQLFLRTPTGDLAHVLRGLPADALSQPLTIPGPPVAPGLERHGLDVRRGRVLQPALAMAEDMWLHDADQLQRWADFGVRDGGLEAQQEQARRTLMDSRQHLEAYDYSRYHATLQDAWTLQAEVHAWVESLRRGASASLILQLVLLLPLACAYLFAGSMAGSMAGSIVWATAAYCLLALGLQWIHPANGLSHDDWMRADVVGPAVAGLIVTAVLARTWPRGGSVQAAAVQVVVVAGLTLVLAVVQAFAAAGFGTSWTTGRMVLLVCAWLLAVVVVGYWSRTVGRRPTALANAAGATAVAAILGAVLGQAMLTGLLGQDLLTVGVGTLNPASWDAAVGAAGALVAAGGVAILAAGRAPNLK